ncbi:MAG: helix-turn-helix domain-containing protein [Gemmatimonadota bacterium]
MVHLDEAGRGMAWTELRAPPEVLDAWVEHAWIERFPDPPPSRIWKIVPDPSPHLLVHHRKERRRVRLVGPRSRAVNVSVGDRRWTVGIRLRPGTLPALTGLTARELTDRSARPGMLYGAVGREWENRIGAAPTPTEALHRAFGFLRQILPDVHRVDWKVRLLLRSDPSAPGLRVGGIARGAGISRRALHEAVSHAVGLSPKATLSIRRLFRVLRAGLRCQTPNWSRIAVDSGYHDGPHLIRDFQHFLGEPPTVWRARAGADLYKP